MPDGEDLAAWQAILDLEARGLLFSAHDAAMTALARAPQDWRLAHRAVLNLARCGATGHALALFGELRLHGVAEPELAALEARLLKDSALAVTSPALLAQAHTLGLKVVPWTVNDTALIDKLLDWGVDGLITDYPDRLRTVMARRGLPLP